MDVLKDSTGKRFGRWVVIRRTENRGKSVMWECLCDCGKIKIVQGTSLKSGRSTSCGCGRIEHHRRTHGLTKHPLYRVWQRMKGCTTSPSHQDFQYYGARGISIHSEWEHSFETFYSWAMENGWKEGLEIDRIDSNGNYCPENCWFTDRSHQMRNTSRTHRLTYNGKTQSLIEWAIEMGIPVNTLYARINQYGWSVEKALNTPIKPKKNVVMIEIDGVVKTRQAWCDEYGISPQLYEYRIKHSGLSPIEALRKEKQK